MTASGEFGPAGRRPHLRILASAGSGKTFQLSSRFLALVHRGAPAPALLATTFSRAAAAEIRDRVLQRAARAVLDRSACAELGSSIADPDFDPEAASALLSSLVAALPRLQIRTIDSLFAGVVLACAAELGLPAEPRVLDPAEEGAVVRRAIGRALEQRTPEDVLESLVSLARGARAAAVVDRIERDVSGLLTLRADSAPDAWDDELPPAVDDAAWQALLEDLARLATTCDGRSIPKAIVEDQRRIQAARAAGQGVDGWGEVATKGLVAAIAADKPRYGTAKIPADVAAAYAPVVAAVMVEVRRAYGWMTRVTASMVDLVATALRDEKRERGVVSFDDLTRALDPHAHALPALDEIWFRLDARIRHVMLDEFQDTSASQWRALRPIAGELAAHGDGRSSLFAVGDLKQSIYGWRGGEPGILERLDEVTIDGGRIDFDTRPLAESFRSGQAVIDAVNLVFGSIGTNAAVVDLSPAAAATWQRWWAPHTTRVASQGAVRIVELAAVATRAEAEPARVAAAVDAAERHWQRLGGRGGRVAVLVRRNRVVSRIVRALQQRGVPADGRGGGSLLDAPAVLATLQTLRLAEWPEDSIAAFDLANSPLAALVGLAAPFPSTAARRRASARLREAFIRRGTASVVDGVRRALAPVCDAREAARMRQLVETLASLEATGRRSPGELFELLKVVRVDSPAGGGVTVMNVHQSKGLEFDVVILTDLDCALGVDGTRAKVAWSSPALPAETIPSVSRWVREALRWPAAERLHDDTQTRAVLESLCLLYVAMTRAKQVLEIHVDPPRERKSGGEDSNSARSIAAVLREAVGGGDCGTGEDGSTIRWSTGELDGAAALARLPSPTADEPAARPSRLRVLAPPQRVRVHRGLAASARGEDRRFLFELHDESAAEAGRAMHACFEQVAWSDGDPPVDAQLVAAIRRVAAARDAQWIDERIAEFRTALGEPAIDAALRRPAGDVEVLREHRYLRIAAQSIEEGAIDRLVLHRDARGACSRAEVFDFKTGGGGDPASLARRHGAQLAAYREVVAEQFGLPQSAVACFVVATRPGVVVEL